MKIAERKNSSSSNELDENEQDELNSFLQRKKSIF